MGPVNSDGQLCAFHEFRTFSKSVRTHGRRLLLNGCRFIACLLQFSPILPWNLQQILMWTLSQWTVTSLLLSAYVQTHRRILSIFQFLRLPQQWTFDWWLQSNVVYMRLHWNGDFYIGSTESTVFLREQSRTRKYRQHVLQQLAFFEPAIKLRYRRDNFYQFCIFPIDFQCGAAENRLSREQALQHTFRPVYNWPWITPLLKRWQIGRNRFGCASIRPTVEVGRKLVRRYRKRTRGQHCSLFRQQFTNNLRIFHLLHMLGSDTLMKFECSKLLRSSQADQDYITYFYYAV